MEQSYPSFTSPDSSRNNKFLLIEIVLGAVALVLLFMWWYSGSSDRTQTAQPEATGTASEMQRSQGFGSVIAEEVKNPGAELTQANPFQTGDNPFANVYQNPFE